MHHITLTLHVYELSLITGAGGYDDVQRAEKAAKLMAAVQDSVSTFVSVKKLDVFDKSARLFKTIILGDVFLAVTKYCLCLDLTGPQAQRWHESDT